MLSLGADLRYLRKNLPGLDRMRLQYVKAPRPVGAQPAEGELGDELVALVIDLTFIQGMPEVRGQSAFEERLSRRKGQMMAMAAEACALVARILDGYQRLRGRISGITQVNWLPAVADIRGQLDAMVYQGFLTRVPFSHLKDYPRYLTAAEQRVEKLLHAADRDRQRMAEMSAIQARWEERVSAARAADRQDARLDEIRWMLEELRVSLFAQQLGTAYPVSVKRVEARWRELGL
jgi:ATP-dependent helicase HrpA